MAEAVSRPVWADVDLGAVTHNVARLVELVAPAAVCAVVKANGYGHGAVPAAGAALAGGATWLAVAFVEEGLALRQAGIEAPILLLSEPAGTAMTDVVAAGLVPTVYSPAGVDAAAAAGVTEVHLKVDTGMHRVGARPADAVGLVQRIGASGLRLQGLWTHLAVADEPERDATTKEQLDRFEEVRDTVAPLAPPALIHAANSAGAIAHPAARYDLVRCGIAIYGIAPAPGLAGGIDLRPALTLRAEVTHAFEVGSGEGVSYGHRYVTAGPTTIAVVPAGYADGVPRRWFECGGRVLIGGRPRPLAGVVTMDQLMVDCGPGSDVAVGDEAVLLGRQGDAAITADDIAAALGTISYEVVCGIGPRVQRRYP